MTPMTSSRARTGTESIDVKRFSSTSGTHFQRGSLRTSRAASGTRAFATQPTMPSPTRSEEHTSELQSRSDLVCRLLLEKKKKQATSSDTAATRPTITACDQQY